MTEGKMSLAQASVRLHELSSAAYGVAKRTLGNELGGIADVIEAHLARGERDGEVVAWRWQTIANGVESPWRTTTDKSVVDQLIKEPAVYRVHPLYTHPAPSQAVGAVDAKPEQAVGDGVVSVEIVAERIVRKLGFEGLEALPGWNALWSSGGNNIEECIRNGHLLVDFYQWLGIECDHDGLTKPTIVAPRPAVATPATVQSLIEAARCLGVAQAKNDKAAIAHWEAEVAKYMEAVATAGDGVTDVSLVQDWKWCPKCGKRWGEDIEGTDDFSVCAGCEHDAKIASPSADWSPWVRCTFAVYVSYQGMPDVQTKAAAAPESGGV